MESAAREADRPLRQFEYRGFSDLFAYWQDVRNGMPVPALKDFDLLRLQHLLPDILISEVRSAADIHLRFVGTAIVERFGYDPTGRNSLLNQREDMRDTVGRWYSMLVNQPCGALSAYKNIYSSGREAVAECLFLPLRTAEWPCFVSLVRLTEILNWQTVSPLTITAANILDLEWIDLGFGIPTASQSAI